MCSPLVVVAVEAEYSKGKWKNIYIFKASFCAARSHYKGRGGPPECTCTQTGVLVLCSTVVLKTALR